MSITQGEAVFQAVREVLDVEELNEKVNLTEAQLNEVHGAVYFMFLNGVTVHRGNPSEEQLKKYIPGLVNNWIRKDKRLNGGQKYEPKNPGSRKGGNDESIKAMRTLLSVTQDPLVRDQIEAAIEARLEELKPKPVINAEALPESLRYLVG